MRKTLFFLTLLTVFSSCLGQSSQRWRQLATPDTVGVWVQPAQEKPAMPIWGHTNGITVGLSPMSGPRGLLKIYTPYLGLDRYTVINFIAFEPIPKGSEYRGLSELEMSSLDEGKRGKRFWSSNDNKATAPLNEEYPARGVIENINGEETLTVFVFCEPFDNGAKVYVRLRFFESRPYEFEILTYSYDDSVELDYFITSATMGNAARLRTLYLKDGQKSSLEIWPDYKDTHFAPHEVFSVNDMIRDEAERAYFIATPNERDYSQAIYAPETANHWKYKGKFATQYWIKENPTEDLQGLVNGRYTYWGSKAPIPGGISYENFELKENFVNGSGFIFGITPDEAEKVVR